jgi:hypothetical protein
VRVDITPCYHAARVVFVAAIYSSTGELLGCSDAPTEEGARYGALQNWANRVSMADELRVERRRRGRACRCEAGVTPSPWDEGECYKCGGC